MTRNTFIASVLFLLSGCVATTVNVIDRKPVARPFSKVLCFYLEEGCDFSRWDATLYDICLKNHFNRDSGYAERSKKEVLISEELSKGGTTVLISSYQFDSAHSSYTDFLHYIDSLGIDGLLVVGVRSYEHVEHNNPVPLDRYGVPAQGVMPNHYTTVNGAFLCDLFSTKSLLTPVFSAEVGEKGGRSSTKANLNRKVVRQVVESLRNSQYIMH